MAAAFLGLAAAGWAAPLAHWLSLAITVLGFARRVHRGRRGADDGLTTAQQLACSRGVDPGAQRGDRPARWRGAAALTCERRRADLRLVFALEALGSVVSLIFLARVGVQAFQREVAGFTTQAAAQTMD
jgi:hypothetical protein